MMKTKIISSPVLDGKCSPGWCVMVSSRYVLVDSVSVHSVAFAFVFFLGGLVSFRWFLSVIRGNKCEMADQLQDSRCQGLVRPGKHWAKLAGVLVP